jgi:hypothetical protein
VPGRLEVKPLPPEQQDWGHPRPRRVERRTRDRMKRLTVRMTIPNDASCCQSIESRYSKAICAQPPSRRRPAPVGRPAPHQARSTRFPGRAGGPHPAEPAPDSGGQCLQRRAAESAPYRRRRELRDGSAGTPRPTSMRPLYSPVDRGGAASPRPPSIRRTSPTINQPCASPQGQG